MRNSLETRLGIFFALAMCVAVLLIETVGGTDIFRRGYQISANFSTVHGLSVGDPVKLAGVRVGTVNGVELDNDVVVVTMKIDEGRRIRTTSQARVNFAGLMGQSFIDLSFGAPNEEFIDPGFGGNLQTVEQPDINDLMARMENVAKGVGDMTKSFSGDSLRIIMTPMAEFIRENSPKLSGILDNMQVVSQQIAQGNGTIGKMVMDETLHDEAVVALGAVNNSSGKINSMLTDLSDVMASTERTMAILDSGRGTMGLLIKDEALYRESTTAMVNLREMLEKMNNGEGSVGLLINEADFLSALTLTLQKVEKATDGLEDQGPLSLISMAFGSLIKF